MPKAELHIHLGIRSFSFFFSLTIFICIICIIDGSVRPRTVIDLAREQGVKLPTYDEAELTKLLTVAEDCPSLVEYLESFAITLRVLQRTYALTRVVYEICEDAYKDGITYIEIRFAPILHTEKGCTLSEIIHAVVEGRMLAEKHMPITCRIIVCAMRQLSPVESLNAAEAAYRYQHQGVVALDVAGPEAGFMPEKHRQAFALARSKGLQVTIHAGEAAGAKSIDHAIRHCGAQRLGHGVALRDEPLLLEKVINAGIAVESCPTSNLQTKAVKSLDDHPIKTFFDKGVIIFPNTDNVTVSGVTLSGEYYRLHTRKNFAVEEIVLMMDYSFKSAFVSYHHRSSLRVAAMQKILTYLNQQGFDISGLLQDLPIYDRLFYSIFPTRIEPLRYWDKSINPPITPEIIRALPKADLHVRLVGGMTYDTLWEESVKLGDKSELVKDFKTKEAMIQSFKNMSRPFFPSEELADTELHGSSTDSQGVPHITAKRARKYMVDVLQTAEQLNRCMDDIYRVSKEDGIIYFEFIVRPINHTLNGLTEDQVVEVLVAAKKACEEKYQIRSSIFLACRVPDDDPIQFMNTAERILKYRDGGVIGFATLGDDLSEYDMQFYLKTFWLLKQHNIPVVLSAARTNGRSIIPAVIDGGAIRISGAYAAERSPHIVKFLSDRQIPVDLSVTRHMMEHSHEMHSFAGNVIRFMMDNDVVVLLASIGRSLELYNTLVDNLTHVVADCGIKVHELVSLLAHSFRCSALPFAEREQMYRDYIKRSTEILERNGFKHFWKKVILPDYTIPFRSQPEIMTPYSSPKLSPAPPGAKGTMVITPAGESILVSGGSSMMLAIH